MRNGEKAQWIISTSSLQSSINFLGLRPNSNPITTVGLPGILDSTCRFHLPFRFQKRLSDILHIKRLNNAPHPPTSKKLLGDLQSAGSSRAGKALGPQGKTGTTSEELFPPPYLYQNFNSAPNVTFEGPDFESLQVCQNLPPPHPPPPLPSYLLSDAERQQRAAQSARLPLETSPRLAWGFAVRPPPGFAAVACPAICRSLNLAAKIPGCSGCRAQEPDAAEAAGSPGPTRCPRNPRTGKALSLSPARFRARVPTPKQPRKIAKVPAP